MTARHVTLCVSSPFELEVSRPIGAMLWKSFMAGTTSHHSAKASTLPYMIRRAEREGVPYLVEAHPGLGYTMRRVAKVPNNDKDVAKAIKTADTILRRARKATEVRVKADLRGLMYDAAPAPDPRRSRGGRKMCSGSACKGRNKMSARDHACPCQVDINNDTKTKCNCCSDCESECAAEI